MTEREGGRERERENAWKLKEDKRERVKNMQLKETPLQIYKLFNLGVVGK